MARRQPRIIATSVHQGRIATGILFIGPSRTGRSPLKRWAARESRVEIRKIAFNEFDIDSSAARVYSLSSIAHAEDEPRSARREHAMNFEADAASRAGLKIVRTSEAPPASS